MRLAALDVFRGATIALMILVDMAGASDRCYPALDHAPWLGWTPTDLVFPFFLFAVGMAIAVTEKDKADPAKVYPRILKRTVILFGLGVVGDRLMTDSFATTRLMGVLQRIALCYAGASLIVLHLRRRAQIALCAFILVAYWLLLTRFPVPGYGAGMLTREGSLPSYVDRLLLGTGHLYRGDHWAGMGDPEGLLSTFPALVSTMIGYFAGLRVRNRKPESRASMDLVLAGVALATLGYAWSAWLPIIKKIWTSSYAALMGGFALIAFGACYEVAEVRGARRWFEPLEHFGRNSLLAFVGSVLTLGLLEHFNVGGGDAEGGLNLLRWTCARVLAPWVGPYNASALFAASMVLFWWVVMRWIDRRGIRVKA